MTSSKLSLKGSGGIEPHILDLQSKRKPFTSNPFLIISFFEFKVKISPLYLTDSIIIGI